MKFLPSPPRIPCFVRYSLFFRPATIVSGQDNESVFGNCLGCKSCCFALCYLRSGSGSGSLLFCMSLSVVGFLLFHFAASQIPSSTPFHDHQFASSSARAPDRPPESVAFSSSVHPPSSSHDKIIQNRILSLSSVADSSTSSSLTKMSSSILASFL